MTLAEDFRVDENGMRCINGIFGSSCQMDLPGIIPRLFILSHIQWPEHSNIELLRFVVDTTWETEPIVDDEFRTPQIDKDISTEDKKNEKGLMRTVGGVHLFSPFIITQEGVLRAYVYFNKTKYFVGGLIFKKADKIDKNKNKLEKE